MTPIPGIAYLIVGVIVTVYSKIVISKGDSPYAMQLFLYLGVILLGVGLYKTIMQYRRKPTKETTSGKALHERKSIIICKSCGSKNYSTSNYCHICGTAINKGIAKAAL